METSLKNKITKNKVRLLKDLSVDMEFLAYFTEKNFLTDSAAESINVKLFMFIF